MTAREQEGVRERTASAAEGARPGQRNRMLPGHWIVGLTEGPSSRGALIFADWLARRLTGETNPDFTVVEVLDESLLMDRLRFENRDELIDEHRRRSADLLAELGVEDSLGLAHVSVGWKVEDALERRLARLPESGLLIGRQAGTSGFQLRKLGKLTRHLIKEPPAPVLVVPSDLLPDRIGRGPVLALVDGSADADRACRAARELGQALGRRTRLVRPEGAPSPGPAPGCEIVAAPDASAESVLPLAAEADAVLLVAVSKQLTLGERILEGDLGSRLAAEANRPVLVLPSEADEQAH